MKQPTHFLKQPTHFIEVIKRPDGKCKAISPYPIFTLRAALAASERFGLKTIAVFKVYPK